VTPYPPSAGKPPSKDGNPTPIRDRSLRREEMNQTVDPLQPRSKYTDEALRRELRYLLKMSDEGRLMEAVADVYRDAVAETQKLEHGTPSLRRPSSHWQPLIELLETASSLIIFTLPPLSKPKV
jgi:hypothetical protein